MESTALSEEERKARNRAKNAVYRERHRDAILARQRAHRAQNRARYNQLNAEYRAADPEKYQLSAAATKKKYCTEYASVSAEWRVGNVERIRAARRAWYAKNRAAEIARVHSRKERIRQTMPLSPAEQAEIQGLYDFCRAFPGYEVDHIIPLKHDLVSGLHTAANLQILPRSENRRKGNRWIQE